MASVKFAFMTLFDLFLGRCNEISVNSMSIHCDNVIMKTTAVFLVVLLTCLLSNSFNGGKSYVFI